MPIYQHKDWRDADWNDYGDNHLTISRPGESDVRSKGSLVIYTVASFLLMISGVIAVIFSSILLYKSITPDSNSLMTLAVALTGVQILFGLFFFVFGNLALKFKLKPKTVNGVKLLGTMFLVIVSLASGTLIIFVINLRNDIADCVEDSCVKNKNAFDNMEFLYLFNFVVVIAAIVCLSIHTFACVCLKTRRCGIYCCESTAEFEGNGLHNGESGYAEIQAMNGCITLVAFIIAKIICCN